MTAVIIIFVLAVALPSFGAWWAFRTRGLRILAAMAGGQLFVTPAMMWIAWHEATPADNDAWVALASSAVAALVISVVWLVVIERWTGTDFS